MSTGDVYCPECNVVFVYTLDGYQCPSCKKYWNARFPITITEEPRKIGAE